MNNDCLDNNLNITHIILLPKKEDSKKVEDFRHISLCNVAMKLITKVVANRLREILPQFISQSQSAFVKDGNISDNILLAQEVSHCIRRRNKGLKGILSIKVDMSKAFDRVEWTFLKEMLRSLGFHNAWVCKVMRCVESVCYTLKINGKISEVIVPSRDLRQGDPLSPYLFIICQE